MKLIECYDVKPIYLIDEYGNVYKNGDKLKSYKDHNGYLQIKLSCLNNKRRSILVHRLVALTFIPNIKNKETVNHIDGNKLNNHVSNLEWMTMLENLNDAKRLGYNGNYANISKELVNKVIKDLEEGFSVKEICKKHNCSINFICRIRQNKRHKEIKRNILSECRKYSLLQKKEICWLIIHKISDKKIIEYYKVSKSYCYNIRKKITLKDIYDFVLNNNFEPSTTIKNHFNINGE